MLFKSFNKFSKKIALISSNSGNLTYQNLIKETNKFKKIIPKRSLVLIITSNSFAPIISYIAGIKNDFVSILVDIKTNEQNIANIIKSYKPTFLILPKNSLFKFSKKKNLVYTFYDYSIIKRVDSRKVIIDNELSVLMPTSGSMGSQKFVKISKRNLKSNTESIIKYLRINSKDRSITNMPFSYSYMLSIINTHLQCGGSIMVTNCTMLQKEFWIELAKCKISIFNGVPYIYEILIRLGLEKFDMSHIKTFTQAGGKLDEQYLRKLIKFCKIKNKKFIVMYGQTEASPRMTYLNWKNCENKIGSIGKAIPFTKIWISDDRKKKINKPFQVGELTFSGKNVSSGYANKWSDLNKKYEKKNILYTGDLAYFDKERFFYIKGRKNRIFKIFGNRVNLDEIELRMKKKNYDVAVREIKNKLNIFYEKSYSKLKIVKNINDIIEQDKFEFNCIKVKKFPRTNSGKINYQNLNSYA